MIGIYRLNIDGSVPNYVIDGGYFAHFLPNEPSPQDYNLVGVVTDDAPVRPIEDENALANYLIQIGAESWTDDEGNPVDVAELSSAWVSRRANV